MAQTAADVFIETIQGWGVEVVFGLPGDGINGIMEALRKRQDRIRFVQVRHEELAALMACACAKFTGHLGVCVATSGPGGLHLLNGLYDAKLDGQPVLAITGHHFHDLIDTHGQQDVSLDRVFMDVADLQEHETDKRSRRAVPGHTSEVWARHSGLPSAGDLRRAADVLNAGKKVAILAGRGALAATDELERLADTLGAPIIKALLGKTAVPDDSPYTTGRIGLLGTKPSQDAIQSCDTLFLVGTSFPYIEFCPMPGEARAVQLDADPVRIGLRYPVEVGLVGDTVGSADPGPARPDVLPLRQPHHLREVRAAGEGGRDKEQHAGPPPPRAGGGGSRGRSLRAPLPANITGDQAKKFAEALVKGQPAGAKIVRAVLEGRIKEMV